VSLNKSSRSIQSIPIKKTSGFYSCIFILEEDAGVARRHPCPSEEDGGEVGGSSTKMEQDAPEPNGNRANFPRWGKRSVISNHFFEL